MSARGPLDAVPFEDATFDEFELDLEFEPDLNFDGLDLPPRARSPRRPREFTSADYGTAAACFASSLCLCWLVFARLTDGGGWLGFGALVSLAFLLLFGVVTADRLGRGVAIDRLVTVIVIGGAAALLVPLVLLVSYIVIRGWHALTPGFFVKDQAGVTPTMDSTAGGASHAMVGTLEQVGLSLVWSLPLGLAAAVFLNETQSKWRRPVRIFVDAMSGLPSIIAGLFIYAVFILPFARSLTIFGFNGLMASLALSMIMLPTITRTVEVVLRLVPDGVREASLALGASRARTVWSVVIPTARTGITTAVVLGIARIVGETAPLLFTAFGYDLMNSSPVDGAQESLPIFIYRNIRKPSTAAIDRGFAGALVLMLVVVTLFVIARLIGRDRSRRGPARRRRPSESVRERPSNPRRSTSHDQCPQPS